MGANLLEADTPGRPLIRPSRIVAGTEEPGAANVPVLLADSWLEFPTTAGSASARSPARRLRRQTCC